MAQTTSDQMVIPEVWADLTNAEFQGKLVFGQPGFSVSDNTLQGRPGDRINFPSWNTLSGADLEVAEGSAIVPERMSTNEGPSAVIKEIGKAVDITDKAKLVGRGDPASEARNQIATVIARKIDHDLKVEAETTSHVVDGTSGPLGWNTVVQAIQQFGDEWVPEDMAGLVIHSSQHHDLLQNDHFLSRDQVGDLAVIPRGFVGSLAGVPVVVSDRITSTGSSFKALLVRQGALGVLWKRRPVVETDRDVLGRTQVIAATTHYATKLLDADGVVVLETQ